MTNSRLGVGLWLQSLMLVLLLLAFSPLFADDTVEERATAAIEAGDAGRAIEMLDRAIRSDRNNANLHYLLGAAEAAHIGSRNTFGQMRAAGRMRRAWERAIELDPDHIQARFSMMVYYVQAPGIAGGDKDKARVEAAEISRRDEIMGHRARAVLASMDDDFPGAVGELEQALTKVSDDPETRATLLQELGFMCQRAENWACAHEAFSRGVVDDPEFMMGWYQIGRTALNARENVVEGIAALARYLAHEPKNNDPSLAWAHTRIAELHMLNNDHEQATFHVRQALSLESDHEMARELQARLEACAVEEVRSC